MATNNDSSGCNPFGCFFIIASVLLVWAALFGVTVAGKHYGLKGCDTDKGVEIDK